MEDTPRWLTEGAIEKTMALGREMSKFLQNRESKMALGMGANVEPHPELVALIASIKSERIAQSEHDRD